MNSKRLVDAIVRQTTVLLAEIATAAGIRAPLAHVADQVFVELAREIESQGVGRKVVADMFGLALRTYQKKVQRLTESMTVRDRSLWEVVLDHLATNGPTTRVDLLNYFARDDDLAVVAVLNDLSTTGLVRAEGRGDARVFSVTSDAERRQLDGEERLEATATAAWAVAFRRPRITTRELIDELGIEPELVREALGRLRADGRLVEGGSDDDAELEASAFVVPVGAELGWEEAVFDHFQAVAAAIATKIRRGRARSDAGDLVGGGTLRFGIHPDHPDGAEVLESLSRVRREMNTLWTKVTEYNRAHPVPEEQRTKVTFYFGQSVEMPESGAAAVKLDAAGEASGHT